MARARKPSKSDLAEVGRGKGSARDKREAAAYRSTLRGKAKNSRKRSALFNRSR